jgi:NAD(P)-dependent dehydrogenase (short-subunit alcohol dehydrogenase family)
MALADKARMPVTPISVPIFVGRTAIVTGAARGLGLAMARTLAENGASIALFDRLDTVAESAVAVAEETGVHTVGVEVDVTDPTSIETGLDIVASELGVASVLVNSAGITSGNPALETTLDQWTNVLTVNLTGTFLVAQAFAKRVIEAELAATIVNIASMSSFIVNVPQTQTPYNVSKAAVAMLTKSLAIEWLQYGIRINGIAPGYFASDMTRDFVDANPGMASEWIRKIPAGRMGEPHELGDLLVYLASERSQYVVGQNILIDGGYTIV